MAASVSDVVSLPSSKSIIVSTRTSLISPERLTFTKQSIAMKGLFKSKQKTPVDLVRQTRDLVYTDCNTDSRESKRGEKFATLSKFLRELKQILYGNSEAEPISEQAAVVVVGSDGDGRFGWEIGLV
ncbi:putative armadillo-like helical protein [Helianthus annuus]|nr:putative armadillo-like helical protein [Helianthus annuus]